MKNLLKAILFLYSVSAYAANYNGDIMQFKQPDGSNVDVKMFGSEYYMRAEGLNGYTVIRDNLNKWIFYAKLSDDGTTLQSTGIVYHGVQNDPSTLRNDLGLPYHLQINLNARQKVIEENQKLLGKDENKPMRIGNPNQPGNTLAGTPIFPVSGNIVGLCIVVDFSDQPATVPVNDFDAFCNDTAYTGYSNNGSLRSFYRDISGGLLDYQNVVFGYYRAPQTFAYYDAQPYAVGAQDILGQALNWIANQGFNFSTLSLNPDNTIMAINLMYTGNPPTWSQGMWYHKGYYSGFSHNGVFSGVYNCSPANAPLTLGTVAHENGHMIGKWPDTYKYDQSEDGIGKFDLMCASGDPHNPVPPNPLFRSNAGWTEMVDVTNFNGLNHDTATGFTCYRYSNVNDTNEFFLLEHRQQTGRSMSIPDEGLTIWHIDRNGDNQTLQEEVYLEHANNDLGNDYAACYFNPFATEFSQNTTPNSEWYNGNPSGLIVWGIDSPVVDVLPYYIGLGSAAPNLTLQYLFLSGDNNSNGFLEPGESAELNLYAENNGQISSSNATLFTSAIGPNAGYITVINPVLNMGAIGLSQPYSALVNISADPLTPLGTEVDIQFILADNSDTATLTISLIIGRQVIMNNTNSTLCSAVFYDPGFLSNYNLNTNFKKTFFPSTTGDKIRADFTSFIVQYDSLCNTDYLKIYDGADTSQLIGTYCGFNSPGIIQSTDPSGALTFVFHSDSSVTALGWMAIISCTSGIGIDENQDYLTSMYPNPTSGKILLKSQDKIAGISVTDAMGREIKTIAIQDGNNQIIDLSAEADGVYFLKYKIDDRIYCRKILKK